MALDFRVIQASDLDELLDYEQKKLAEIVADEDERQIQSWHARWRKESLLHYLPMGWSFLARDPEVENATHPEGALVGFFLAQPFLFMDGQTQTLWVEHLSYSSLQARDQLCELASKLGREKHFQRVLFPNSAGVANSVRAFKAEPWNAAVLCVKTVK